MFGIHTGTRSESGRETTFVTDLLNICYDYFLVAQMLYRLFLCGIIDWIFKNMPLRNGGGSDG